MNSNNMSLLRTYCNVTIYRTPATPLNKGGAHDLVMSTKTEAPSSSQRQQCYTARDNYYKCLEDKEKDNNLNCQKLKDEYNKVCLSSWVKYFERKHVFDQYKKKLQEDGYQENKEEN